MASAERQADAGLERHLDLGITGQDGGIVGAKQAARDEDAGAVAQPMRMMTAIMLASFKDDFENRENRRQNGIAPGRRVRDSRSSGRRRRSVR